GSADMAKFEEIERNSGVDSLKPGTEWIMVPKGKSNIVCLTGGAGYGVKAVEGTNKVSIAEIHKDKQDDEVGRINAPFIGKDDKLLRITGLHQGPGKIAATKGSDKAELKFSVHGSRTFNISFFFLSDLDGQNRSTPRSAFSQKDAPGWVEKLNQVYGPQANIWFELGKNMPLAISGLDKVVTSDHAKMLAEHKDTQVASGKTKDSKAPIRVFLAGPALQSNDKSEPFGFYHIDSKVILLKDQQEPKPGSEGPTSLMLKTLAHEIGHFLNYLQGHGQGHDFFHDTGYAGDILNTVDGGNIKISRQRVLDWNPT
ncbi:MAG: hypothetical protein V7608_1784, partial [Hyphomicrobiales bacterium]